MNDQSHYHEFTARLLGCGAWLSPRTPIARCVRPNGRDCPGAGCACSAGTPTPCRGGQHAAPNTKHSRAPKGGGFEIVSRNSVRVHRQRQGVA